MESIKVSVLTPIYNHNAAYVKECLKSLESQTMQDIEFLLIDNEATKEAKDLMEQYVSKDTRFRIIRVDKNEGYGKAMNLGLKEAKGEYIGIVESDDIVNSDMFADLYENGKYFDSDIVKCLFKKFENEKVNLQEVPTISFKKDLYYKKLKPEDIPEYCSVFGSYWSAIYKKSFLDENGILYDVMPCPSAEDIMFMLKTFCVAESIVIIEKNYYYHRMDNPNSSIKKRNQITWDCLALYKKLDEFINLKKEKISPKIVGIKDYREFKNLYGNFMHKNFREKRLKYLLGVSKRFKNLLKRSRKVFSEDELYIISEIAEHPIQFYFREFLINTKFKNTEKITSVLKGLLKITQLKDNKKIYFLWFKLMEIYENSEKSQKKKELELGLFKKIRYAWMYNPDANKSILNEYEMMCNSDYYWNGCNNRLWLIFISVLMLENRYEEAKRILRRYVDKIGYVDIPKFLPVADLAYSENYYTPDIEKASFVYRGLIKNINNKIFENYLKDSTVAIVGNASGEKGKNRGGEIDSHDVVIRFNNYPKGHEADYGKKTNVWFHGTGSYYGDIKDNRDLSEYDLIVWDYNIFRSELQFNHLDVLYESLKKYPEKITCLPDSYTKEIADDWDVLSPSSGALTLYSVSKIKNLKDIDVYGFSFLEDNLSFKYYDDASISGTDYSMNNELKMLREIYSSIKD